MRRRTRGSRGRARATTGSTASVPVTRTASAGIVSVALDWQLANGILTLTATTPGHGACCEDSWWATPPLALTSATVVEACVATQPCYVSRATVAAASLVPDTTYTFSYAIVMHGREGAWVGSVRVAITVGPDSSVVLTVLGDRAPRP